MSWLEPAPSPGDRPMSKIHKYGKWPPYAVSDSDGLAAYDKLAPRDYRNLIRHSIFTTTKVVCWREEMTHCGGGTAKPRLSLARSNSTLPMLMNAS